MGVATGSVGKGVGSGVGAVAALLLAACGNTSVSSGPPGFQRADVAVLPEGRFAIDIQAVNVDGYEYGKCVAAAHTIDSEKPLFSRDGGRLTDEFRLAGGARTQTVFGVLTYGFVESGRADGSDILDPAVVLERCDRLGISSRNTSPAAAPTRDAGPDTPFDPAEAAS